MGDPLDVPTIQTYVRDSAGNTYKLGGPPGSQGEQGPEGPEGPEGPIGPRGPTGPSSFAQVQESAPTARATGDLWVDSDDVVLEWDDDWVTVSLLNGWTNYLAGYAPARIRKMPGGLVVLDGLIVPGTTNRPFTIAEPGHRPSENILISTFASAGTDELASLWVNADGQVTIRQTNFATWGYMSLSGLSWVAA